MNERGREASFNTRVNRACCWVCYRQVNRSIVILVVVIVVDSSCHDREKRKRVEDVSKAFRESVERRKSQA